MDKLKCCFKCLKELPISQFYTHKQMADGHLNKCKECTKSDVNSRYNKKFNKIRAYEQKRFQDPERKKKVLQYQRTRRLKHPQKTKARAAVARALRKGSLIRMPCEVCSDPASQAHHHDYEKPLDVKWLCFKCHRLEHGQLNVIK